MLANNRLQRTALRAAAEPECWLDRTERNNRNRMVESGPAGRAAGRGEPSGPPPDIVIEAGSKSIGRTDHTKALTAE